MGAYGGTAQASIPPYDWALLADSNNDGLVNFTDLRYVTENWLSALPDSMGNFNRDGIIDFADFALLADEWLKETSWH
jgi:hypothetical protein